MGSFEQLWAPWRMAYIQGDDPAIKSPKNTQKLLPGADPECFICQGVVECNDRDRLVLRRTEHSIVLLNRFPYNNGHLLVAPKHHKGRMDELTIEEQHDLAEEMTRMVTLLDKIVHPEGFNVGLNLGRVAGAGLPGHLHWHIVPRWNGDTNFMTTLAAVKVIPQALETLWEVLRKELASS